MKLFSFELYFAAALFSLALTAHSAFAKSSAQPDTDKPDVYEEIYNATIEGRSLQEYYQQVSNSGWGKNLSSIRKALKPNASYMLIHAQEPKDVMDLRSAENFKASLMSNGLLNMANNSLGIGHVFVGWRCNVNGKMLEGTVGMTGELSNQIKKMMDLGHGMGAFLATYEDGHMQTGKLLDFEFEEKLPLHTMAVEVDPSVCQNGLAFVKKFLFHKNKPYENFGTSLDPLKFEGGGCGSFGAAVLQKSGIFGEHEIIPNFWRTLVTSPKLVGYGLEVAEDTAPYVGEEIEMVEGESRRVSMIKLFTSYWNAKSGPEITMMDPEMFLLFLKTAYRMSLDDIYADDANFAREFKESALYRMRQFKESVPFTAENSIGGPYSTDRVINAGFDEQAATVVENTRAWMQDLRANGYRARPAYITRANNPFAVIYDRK